MEPSSQENQFIPKKEEAGVNAFFEELGSELDHGEIQSLKNDAQVQKKHPIEYLSIGVGILYKIALLVVVVTGIDVTLRNANSSDFARNFPVCSYLSTGVNDYPNTECMTYSEILSKLSTDRASLEKELWNNLAVLIPKKLQIQNTMKSPELQYILAKTSTNRVSIQEMLNKFSEFRTTATVYKGDDIECSSFSLNEKGEMTVTCEFFGFSISGSADKVTTSRSTALTFLEKLRSPYSGFKVLNEPKTLEIQPYTSADFGIKGTFTTKTTLNLKLRYTSPNRI